MKNVYRYCIFIFLLINLISLTTACESNVMSKKHPLAVEGVLDLREWDFRNDGLVKLDGEWEFYWQKLLMPEDFVKGTYYLVNRHLINIPRSWSGYEIDGQPIEGEGYATFRLRVLLPENGQPLSLNLSSIYTSHKLWVNGQLVSTLGEVSINRESCVPKYFPQIIPLKLDGDSAELILQVANFSHRRGGIWRSVTLGNGELIQGIRERQIVYDMVLLGSLLILGLYHLALFSLRKKIKHLYFSHCFVYLWH